MASRGGTSGQAPQPETPLLAAHRRSGGGGQVLVIFALSIVALLVAAGLAFDVGRFYGEKRFLQNAADAAALAAANALIRGESTSEADAEARDVLTRNFAGDPNGTPATLPPTTPIYESGHSGDPSYLINGILISGGTVRVAVQNPVDYTLGRVAGLGSQTIGGRAMVRTNGDLLPIAIRRYINAPGPNNPTPTSPCVISGSGQFLDFLATQDSSCLGTDANATLRSDPSPGSAFDPANVENDTTHHGPVVTLVGQGADPSNAADFRGFITLDVRNFQTTSSNTFYNGVTSGTQPNVLKNFEAAWVPTGYPGPMFPSATTPPDPNDQVGLMNGNDAGIVVDAIATRYVAGDEILAAVYSGTVMTIPDFALTIPDVSIGTTENRDSQVTMNVTGNKEFLDSGTTVTSFAWPDTGDAANPLLTGKLSPLTFSPSPATPNTSITWTSFHTTSAPTGIYTIWIQGHSASPYLTDHYYPVSVNVGGVVRDFSSDGKGKVFTATNIGDTATGTITFSTPNKTTTCFCGNTDITLTLEGAAPNGTLPPGIGATSLTPSAFKLQNKGDTQAVNVSINAGSLSAGNYQLKVRATGTNKDGQPVTHVTPIELDVATAGTSNNYVDIMGFAVFRITTVASNHVDGYAISPVIADMNDPRLVRGQVARLVPWS